MATDPLVVLSDLIQTSADGEQGFEAAARITKDPQLISLFEECAQKCHIAATQLQAKVAALGGHPSGGGSVSGAVHRGWTALKSKVADSDLTVLEEVERGEDYAKAAYANALKADLPADVRELVQRQMEGAVQAHNRIRDLRNSRRAQVRH